MAKVILGERVGKLGTIRVGSSAVVFDYKEEKILLTRRADNGQWCIPGGGMDQGESITENCAREILEETGLRVRVGKLIGVYSNPNRLIEYADGNRYHVVVLSFRAEVIGGELGLSDETTDYGYFSSAEIEKLDLMEHHRERIEDALANQAAAFIR